MERGWWKLVSRASTQRNSKPGRMKRCVLPDQGSVPPPRAAVSRARTHVVPTATTRPPRALAASICSQSRLGHLHRLAVHPVSGRIVGTDRLVRARADVQGKHPHRHSAGGEPIEHRRVEVKTGGGRGHRPRPLRVHRLVTLGVGGLGATPEVGRQRDLAVALQHLGHRAFEVDPVELAFPADAHPAHGGAQLHLAADPQPLARPDPREEPAAALDPFDEDLDPPTGRLAAGEPRPQDPGIVEDQQVARAQIPGKSREPPVRQPRPADHEQPARGTGLGRMAGDERIRKPVVEVRNPHRPSGPS